MCEPQRNRRLLLDLAAASSDGLAGATEQIVSAQ
jgi:hypothetical protein